MQRYGLVIALVWWLAFGFAYGVLAILLEDEVPEWVLWVLVVVLSAAALEAVRRIAKQVHRGL